MEVVREDKDNLNAQITVKIKEADYAEKVDNALKKYRKQAKMPGFRTGMVPMGMIKKMVGNNILADEINHLLSHAVQDYIKDNKLDILGQPLPVEDGSIDWENQKDFDFKFELGLAPEVNVSLSDKDKFELYQVKVTDKMVNEQLTELAKRYGKMTNAEVSEEGDILYGKFEEMNGKSVKEDGISNDSVFNISVLKDKKDQKKFYGLKPGDSVVFNPKKVAEDHYVSSWLGIGKEILPELKSDFRFTVDKINRMEPAEINQEFLDKMYGEGKLKSEDELKDKIREELEKSMEKNAEALFEREVQDYLLKKAKLSLPDEFMKKWLLQANEKPISKEQIEEEYEQYSTGLKWQLIENKLIKDNNIQVSRDEMLDFIVGVLKDHMQGMEDSGMDEEDLKATANRILENQEEAQRVYEQLYKDKLKQFYKDTVKVKTKEIDYDDFVKLANKKSQ